MSVPAAPSSSAVPSGTPAPEDAVRQIFRYLAEVGESRTKPVRNHDDSRHRIWFSELPDTFASFLTDSVPGESPLWLRADRPVRHDPPGPPDLLAHWLDNTQIRDSGRQDAPTPTVVAELPSSTVSAGGSAERGTVTVALDDFRLRDEVLAQHRTWAAAWMRWAEQDRTVKPVMRAYDQLYRIHEDTTDLGESYELVVGFGHLAWSAAGERVRRHLVTCRAVIAIDAVTGAITVGPDPESGAPVLEESMLDADQKARAHTRALVQQDLEEAGDTTDPFAVEPLHRALNAWVIAAHEAGRYERGAERPRSAGDPAVPVVGFAPMLILRERTKRSMLDALRGVAARVEQGAEPTALLRAIAGAGGDTRLGDLEGDDRGSGGTRGHRQELYFALPSNDEQRTIAERLTDRDLVVVQGPPGTGKTHTIANLVTDLLAHGRRVLITSHTARALKVLKDKLPGSIRELCVSRTDDSAAQQELEQSVKAILDRQGDFSARTYLRHIKEHEERLAKARSTQAGALKALRALRERETYRHPADIGDYQGTLAGIAARLHSERDRLNWIGSVPADVPTADAAACAELRRASLAFTTRDRALAAGSSAALPDPAELLSAHGFADAVTAIRAADTDLAALRADGTVSRLDDAVSGLSAAAQDRLATALDGLAGDLATTTADAAPWAAHLREEVLAGRDFDLRSRLERTEAAVDAAETLAASLGGVLVSGLEAYDVPTALGLAGTLRDGLASGEKLRGPLGLKSKLRKAVGDFPETVRVDGQAVATESAAVVVLDRVRLERRLHEIESEWGDGGTAAWTATARRTARLRQDAATLTALARLADRRADVLAAAAAAPGLAGRSWHTDDTAQAVRRLLRARATRRAAGEHRARIAATLEALRAAAHRRGASPVVDRARVAAETQDTAAYAAAVGELDDLREALRLKRECDAAYTVVAAQVPDLADALESTAEDPVWDHRLPDYERAWAWSAWHRRMHELTDPEAESVQMRRLAEADADIRISLERLAADKAWYSCLSRLTDDQAVALTSYQQSVRKLGKGTGKYAPVYRRQARESLHESQEAVPAWIMPLHQVTETVPMDRPGRFDVVIIDEASQSGPEALLLAWLGSKIIVVGDDQQVSPANVGIDHDELFSLQRRMLGGLPASRRNLFTPTASLFDIASGLAGGRGRLMLQEHFRCMPEIIGFSNALCYGGRLQPLRQYGAGRLRPLRSVHIVDGHVEGTGQKQFNRPEAERVVDEIARCIDDPAYRGRTMGVITLLGAGQKFLIEDLLADRIPLDERQRRRLRVGNAEEFQGDERDIVFISLVASLAGADGARRIGPYSSTLARQHINVAASRARDQVWLFHSVTLTELGETDLRRGYLDWFSRPAEEQDGAVAGEVRPDEPHDAFDSLFEQRVYLALRERGYRVRPQYPAGRYRIDLVVEGGTKRLAVECDGDAFHTEENADADAARQRELERVGWTFVRIRGSRFFLDPEKALEPLWTELERLGIETAARSAGGTSPREAGTSPREAVTSPREAGTSSREVGASPSDAGTSRRPRPVPEPEATRVPQPVARVIPSPRAAAPSEEIPAAPEVSGAPVDAEDPEPAGAAPEPRTAPAVTARGPGPDDTRQVWTADPSRFVSAAWLHRDEVNAAQHAFSLRRTVPFRQGERAAGSARFLPQAGAPGHPGADAVEIVRDGKPVLRLGHDEVHAMIRSAIGRVDVPVLVDGRQWALVRHHASYSDAALKHGCTTELLRPKASPRVTAEAGPEPTLRTTPQAAGGRRNGARKQVRASVRDQAAAPYRPAAPDTLRIKVDRLSTNAYRRVRRELDRVQDALNLPVPEIVAVDSSSRKGQLAEHEKRRESLRDRQEFLRAVLDQVVPDPSFRGGARITPGCLVGVEDEDGTTVYEVALLPGGEGERLSPYSAMGEALMWREVGDVVGYVSGPGRRRSVTVRFIED
ncbi:AAA domain-containing protein [Streptomyces sp. NBC_00568]|uniref:AAA domain-containing protein n=1 Tax=Streptomyces sp. NBC_00568 TaxID=2975779 RepID=UPI00224C903E|nr:AAA domain-containing protein [Streptomyces sp. NBC_00568]MCX4987713.1 AAA domain-containing protein [Streptomyces sp. NBC_00568]